MARRLAARKHLLLTTHLERQLPPIGSTDGWAEDSPVVVKFFSRLMGRTWYAIEGESSDDDGKPDVRFFGWVDDDGQGSNGHYTYWHLSELEGMGRKRLPLVERDCHWDQPRLGKVPGWAH